MQKFFKKGLSIFLGLFLLFTVAGCQEVGLLLEDLLETEYLEEETPIEKGEEGSLGIEETGHYTSKEEVALYLHTYKKLPENYLTKREAEALGWEASRGNLWDVTKEQSIGGDRFYNREEKLPMVPGRKYYECDIGYRGGFRNALRIVYSDDGLIYYTEDHYDSFTLLYDEKGPVH